MKCFFYYSLGMDPNVSKTVVFQSIEQDTTSQIKMDHKNARRLAGGISQIKGLSINLEKVKTNILYFDLASNKITGSQLVGDMENKGVKFFETNPNQFRLVTHYGITPDCVKKTLQSFQEVLD